MRSCLFGLFTFLVAATAIADTRTPPAPLGKLAQPWVGLLDNAAVAKLPRTTRTAYPPADLGQLYWGVVTDESTWRELVRRDPHLAAVAPIDFRREAVLFVLQDTIAGGGGISFRSFTSDGSGSWRLSIDVHPAIFDIAMSGETVLLMRVPRADVAQVRLDAGGKIFGEQVLK